MAGVIAQEVTEQWAMYNGDAVEVVAGLPDASIGYTIYSPPFASLYTYSASDRDMGNCVSHEQFHEHYGYLIAQLLRVTKPGRLMSIHAMNLPTSKARDGIIGLVDFRGILIRACQEAGWIYHSEVCIWKDPVTAMQRTKAIGLLHKQLLKDSALSRQGIPDYLVTLRKPGDNPEPISGDMVERGDSLSNYDMPGGGGGRESIEIWQRLASPIWTDINPSDTLQYRSAREEEDEKHICPLQLEVIRRGIELWSNPGETVLSPFAGIGSEGYIALGGATRTGAKLKPRRFVGVELKESYYQQAVANLRQAQEQAGCQQRSLFGDVP